MRVYSIKASLVLIMLGGAVAGLLAYDQTLLLAGRIFDFHWIYIPVLFVMSLIVARMGVMGLAKDLVATNNFHEISPAKILKFFIGGYIGCYVAFAIVGPIILALYLIFKNFFCNKSKCDMDKAIVRTDRFFPGTGVMPLNDTL